MVAVYNENVVIKAMTDYGYSLVEARRFANDGCWETQVPGKTRFGYMPFDSLALLQLKTLNSYEAIEFSTFNALYSAYVKDLKTEVNTICKKLANSEILNRDLDIKNVRPTSVVSLFVDGCIDNARSYFELGPIYNVLSPHIGGLADTVNSLYAIKKLVFDDKKVSFNEYMLALKNNWKNYQSVYALARSLSYYGTDNDEVDGIYANLVNEFYLACNEADVYGYVKFPAGASTFGREIEWLPNRLAGAFGSKVGDILASNSSPTPNTDTEGVTAVIKSYTKADLTKLVTGTALDVKIAPTTLYGEKGVAVLKSLLKGFVSLGGYFMQLDTVSATTLKKAKENPTDYKTLSVRVSGWNARFITLTNEWQDMIIQRTERNG